MKKHVLVLLLIVAAAFLFALPRELVVVEIATGTWCGYCPGAAMGAHDLLANGHAVAIVKNHNGDNFANTYSNARNSYYGVSGFPSAYFDGLNVTAGGSATQSMYSNYLPKVNARLNVPSHYTIMASGTISDNVMTVIVNVAKPEADTNTNVVLHSSLTQSNIPFNWGNQTTVDNVNRLMSPNQNGTPVNLATGENTNITLTFNINSAWNAADLELVLWLQNVSTKEILQGKKYSIPEVTGGYPASTDAVNFGNMFVNGTATQNIVFSNYSQQAVTATLSVDNPVFTVSASTLNIPAMQASTVQLSFTPTAAQTFNGNLTVNGNFMNHPNLTIPLSGTGFTNVPPVATDVSVVGVPVIYQTLLGEYTFTDADGNTEGASIRKWYRKLGDGAPQLIAGANEEDYTTAEADLGYQIAFEITPVDQHGAPGTPVMSAFTIPIEVLPAPQNFAAEVLPPSTVKLTWERPAHFGGSRGFVGYRIFRNGLNISTITNPVTLQFIDTYVPDGTHEYWICSLFNNPMMLSDPSPVVVVQIGENANEDQVQSPVFSASAYPNPFGASTEIRMKSRANSEIKLSVFNVKGQLIESWTGITDASGNASRMLENSSLESGIYFYRVESAGKSTTGKMIKMK